MREELARVLGSAAFAQAERLSEFLRFVVQVCLEGREDQLKETTIGIEVYGRDPGYDPKVEPIVRTEARRLRAKLDEYYQTMGQHDPVVIQLPKGGYVAHFEVRALPPVEASPPAVDPVVPVPAAAAPRRPGKWLIAGVAVAAGLAALFLAVRPGKPPPLPVVQPLTTYPGYEFQPALSPDGKQFAFVYNGDSDNYDIYVKLLDAGTPLRLTTSPAHDLHPSWSPDGRYLAFLRVSPEKQEIYVVPALGGAERKITEVSSTVSTWQANGAAMNNSGPAWSPDGKYLAIVDRPGGQSIDTIYLLALDSGNRRKMTSPEPGTIGDWMPVFSPDGRQLAFVRTASQRGIMDIYVIPVNGGSERRVTTDRKTITGLTWAGDQRLLFASNRSGGSMIWSVGAKGGTPEPVAIAGRNVRQVTASADGNRVLYTDRVQNANVWRVDLTQGSGAAAVFMASTGRNDSAQYSPDGKRIVFGSDRSGSYELWTANADGSNLLQMTSFGGLPVGTPRWSPDGQQVVFDAVKDGRSVIYRVNANGGQPELVEDDGAGDAMMPAWSRDGQEIYFVSRRAGEERSLMKKRLNAGRAAEIARGPFWDVFESADGVSLYYSSGGGVWQGSPNGGESHRVAELADIHDERYFAVTGRGIYFLRDTRPPWAIEFYDFARRAVTRVAAMGRAPVLGTPSLSVSPDDHWLIYSQMDALGSDIMMLTGITWTAPR